MTDTPDARPGLVVVDIDGVVADVRHRLVHVERSPKDWAAFFAGMADDPLLPEGAALVQEAARTRDVVWLTGRPARYADVTAAWLRAHGLPATPVHHRADGDRRPASVVKTEVVRRLARASGVDVVVDDDPLVCAALESAGFRVLRATWAPDAPGLRRAQEGEGRT